MNLATHPLAAHYVNMFKEAQLAFVDYRYVIDERIDAADDKRMGLTLLFRPDAAVQARITEFLSRLHAVEPDQYYYPATDLHVTVLSIISCTDDFSLAQIEPTQYISLITACLHELPSFSVKFNGVTASPSGIMIQGYPACERLALLRERLRHTFSRSKLLQSLDKRYVIKTAHATVMRLRKPLRNPLRMNQFLNGYRHVPFGVSKIDRLTLVYNDWYQRRDRVQELHHFDLVK